MANITLQLYSLKEEAETNFLGVIERVGDMGYDGVQFAGFFDASAVQVRESLDKKGLKRAGSHVGIHQLGEERLEELFSYHEAIGEHLLICPALPEEMRKTADDYKRSAERLNRIGESCKNAGFEFGYHNHAFEFTDMGEGTGFDLLFKETSKDLVKMELDCYWAAYSSHDPLQIIQTYQDRIVSLHIKDMIGDGTKRSTEVGKGMIDYPGLMREADKVNIDWFTVEQEEFDGNPYDSLVENLAALKRFSPNERGGTG